MTEPNPMTTTLSDILTGATFPEETITVFLDADAMYTYAKATRNRDTDLAKREEWEAVVEAIEEELADKAIKVTIRDIPLSVRKNVVKSVRKEYKPIEIAGRKVDTEKGLEEINTRLWALYITKIEAKGQVFHPTLEDIRTLQDSAPDVALGAIAQAIDNLTETTTSGYSQAVSLDFLSQPSQTDEPDSSTPTSN